MRTTAVYIAFADCKPQDAASFNRWCDLEHIPHCAALPGVTTARRYFATAAMREAREGVRIAALAEGRGAYLNAYFAGEDDQRATAAMKDISEALGDGRRRFKAASFPYTQGFALRKVYVGDAARVAPGAAPYLGHTGIIMSFWEIQEERRAEVEHWWDDDHMPRILETPGIVGGLRFESISPSIEARFMFHVLTEGDPLQALGNLRGARQALGLQGHMGPAEQGLIRRSFTGVYRLLTPLREDFLEG